MDGVAHQPETPTVSDLPDDFKIKGAASTASLQNNVQDVSTSKGKRKASAPEPDSCTICLEPISERAIASPCNHLTFDFLCLVSWLQDHPTCPLCKSPVLEVQYDWRAPHDYKSYSVPQGNLNVDKEGSRNPSVGQRQRRRHARPCGAAQSNSRHTEDSRLQKRRTVYRDRTYSMHVGANRVSQYRDFTPATFLSSTDLQCRARTFLRRELQVFTFLDHARRGNSRDFLVEYIVAVLKTNEVKGAGGRAQDLVGEFLGKENGELLLHELEAWLRSPYERLEDWDRHVQYPQSPNGERDGVGSKPGESIAD